LSSDSKPFWKDLAHAWAESFVGEWIPVDATLPGIFVDATHIKLAEGDTSAIFDAVKAIGNLKAEVLEVGGRKLEVGP